MIVPALRSLFVAVVLLSALPATGHPADHTSDKAKPANAAAAKTGTGGLEAFGLPHYQPPAAYSVDLVVRAEGQNITMKRFIDGNRIRSEMNAEGHDMVMIEFGDEKGTMLMLMPGEKRAIRQSRAAMVALAPEEAAKHEEAAAPPADMKVDDLGEETVDGRVVKKLRYHVAEGTVLGWFDRTSGAPVKMESDAKGQKSTIEWRNYSPGPQPAKLFEVPKGYAVMDMDEVMAKMKTMQGKPGMGAMLGGMAGMGGMGGGAMGMAKGYAGGMAQNFGSSMGGSFGASLGGALGGPLGAIAGQYIGGKIGGMVAKKTADAVIPGN